MSSSSERISDAEAQAIRDGVATAVMHAPRGLEDRLDSDPSAALALVDAARVAAEESSRLLRESIAGARTAGHSWDSIGQLLGVSRQAAQQRFGTTSTPKSTGERRTLAPVTAFEEMDELADAGRHGWHSVDYGTLHHVLEKTDQQWEHKRVLWGTIPRAELESEGWRPIRSNTFPWGYWSRPTGLPAEPEA